MSADLPRVPARWRRPCPTHLPHQYDPPEMIRIMRGQAFQLLSHRHSTHRLTGRRWASHDSRQPGRVMKSLCRRFEALEKASAKRGPTLSFNVSCSRKSLRCVLWIRSLDSLVPFQRYLQPKRDVPELFIKGPRNSSDSPMCEILADAFHNLGGRGGCAVSNQYPLEFIHDCSSA